MTTATEKMCSGCEAVLPLADYHRHSKSKDGHRSRCKACTAEYKKAYREANHQRILAEKRAYREANRERITASNKAHYEANRDEVLARRKAHYEANRDRALATGKAWREANKHTPEYRAQRRAIQTRYYRLKANAKQEPYTRESIFARDEWTCGICDQPIDPQVQWPDPACATIDHVIPLSRGGDDTPANVQAAHGSCNYGKCDRVEHEDRAVAA